MIKYYLMILGAGFVIFLINSIRFRKQERIRLQKKIRESFGSIPDREYTPEELKKIRYYFEQNKESGFFIDDITWNDLDMDHIFGRINHTWSSIGEEYLYQCLRMPKFQKEQLEAEEKLYSFFEKNEEQALHLQKIFYGLGRTTKISLYEFIIRLTELETKSNWIHYLGGLFFAGAFSMLFLKPVFGIVLFFASLIFSISTYYKSKAEVENYFICFMYLANVIDCARELCNTGITQLNPYEETIRKDIEKLKKINKRSFLISGNGTSGSISDIIMEYVRMIFHVDLIKFNNAIQEMKDQLPFIKELYETLGRLEAAMAVASFRKSLSYYVTPEFVRRKTVSTEEIYHPLIVSPVTNSLREDRSVLITGSNASGKSTFLKTIAINLILAQSIHTCTAKSFASCFGKVYSSMALRDNLLGNESYFIVEIKSIKRIVDAIGETGGDLPVFCFVDEVLRGTNTVERIAASTYILKNIGERNALCFAATHDIELTYILESRFSNYHFSEEVRKDDVLFNYRLQKGRASSRNAIKLLHVIGFDQKIVKNAEKMAEEFIRSGSWTMEG